MIFARVQTKIPFLRAHRIPVSLTCQAGDPVDSPVTWASAPADAAAVARDVSDRADGVSGLVDPAHAPTGAVAAGVLAHRSRILVLWSSLCQRSGSAAAGPATNHLPPKAQGQPTAAAGGSR
jgi:hypothetical protein